MKLRKCADGRSRKTGGTGNPSGNLQIQNCDRVNAGPETASDQQRIYSLLYRQLTRRLMLTMVLCSLGAGHANSATFRWVASVNRIYVENGGTARLSDIKAVLPDAPLEVVNGPGKIWLLRADLLVTGGTTLVLHGAGSGGDVNELRLQSNNSPGTNTFVSITADFGDLDIAGTKITSWDDAVAGPDTETATYGRAYIRVRSSLADDGATAQESRMDISNSEICYLGYDGSEAYGLVWKVAGAAPDPSGSIFGLVKVYGDVVNSHLHDNYMGGYAFGSFGMQWHTNEVDHNLQYGLDLQSDSDYVVVSGNSLHDNGNNGLLASVRCDHLTITGNSVYDNAGNGLLLDKDSGDSLVESNQCVDNGDSGISVNASARNLVRNNLSLRNGRAGLRVSLGSADNVLQDNTCTSNLLYGIYLYKGTNTPNVGDDGRPKRNLFLGNDVAYSPLDGLNLAESDDNIFATNTFYANGDSLRLVQGYHNQLAGNQIPGDVIVKTFGGPGVPALTCISNQPALRVQMDEYATTIFADNAGQIFDPEEKHVSTTVTPAGAVLTLNTVVVSTSASTVLARPMNVAVTAGTIAINPTMWTNINVGARQWLTRANNPTRNPVYTISDLSSNQVYTVRKAGVPLFVLSSGNSNQISFADVAGTTNDILYAVELGPEVAMERYNSGLRVSWKRGKLQRTTSLNPPDWQDVGNTNGQITIDPAEPAEFFRSIPTTQGGT